MFNMMNLTLPLVYVYLLLQHRIRNVNAHTRINAHRPWACRGMPFDDVCQIAPQGANLSARWPEIFFSSKSLPLGEGPRMASSTG